MFNDQEKINTISKIDPGEIETIYWKLEDVISDGNRQEALVYFEMLGYLLKYRTELTLKNLRKKQLQRLNQISYQFINKEIPSNLFPILEKEEIREIETPFEKEKNLNEYLCKNRNILINAVDRAAKIMATEFEIDEFKCDIIAETKTTLYAIELKNKQADHRAVSQLDKYCHYFYLNLRYSAYKDVKGICIANGFCKWSINEFRRRGRRIFTFRWTNDKLSLIEVI